MLETRNLYKMYRPRRGVPVTALNNVSIQFPERGMVFLLGKSGSGKSTLLNLLGGLDRYDQGEILIKGVSSRMFRQKHFDSYRNTYVGFIFQEYNVLEDFTVGANIGLALELQGKKATDAEINAILNQVDLAGLGGRRPNELSGGQKQRVAIARALVKQPEIIMADEPTGALDSATGRQVLETLKRLSADKLVIVVSHDREFAERYADRIIELADGRVIRDVERTAEELPAEPQALQLGEDGITVSAGYQLTEEDRLAINEYLAALSEGRVPLRLGSSGAARFAPTDPAKFKRYDGSTFRLIKSKLPFHSAFRLGANGLTHKRLRLSVTILLSCVAFLLFGLSDTFASYNHKNACTRSLIDSNVTYASIVRSTKITGDDYTYWDDWGYQLKDEELKTIAEHTGVEMTGVWKPLFSDLSFETQVNPELPLNEGNYPYYTLNFSGFAEVTNERLGQMGYTLLAGRLPQGDKNEIAISAYMAENFVRVRYAPPGASDYQLIASPGAMVGKVLKLNNTAYTVTGVVDTQLDLERYHVLSEEDDPTRSPAEQLILTALEQEFEYARSYSLASVAMVGEGALSKLIEEGLALRRTPHIDLCYRNSQSFLDPEYIARLSDFPADGILWLDGQQTTLKPGEFIISADLLDGAVSAYDEEGEYIVSMEGTYKEQAEQIGALNAELYSGEADPSLPTGCRIVGVLDPEKYPDIFQSALVDDALYTHMVGTDEGIYAFAVGVMPETESGVRKLVSFCYDDSGDIRYPIQSAPTYELDIIHSALQLMAKVFFWIGLILALFAALLMANFISTSIAYKKQEIGILRAIGSRSNDVFRIFFYESGIIALINFVLSTVLLFVLVAAINLLIRQQAGILITVLVSGPRQILLLLTISLGIAAISSFLPVKRIASKRPIDAIRDR